MHIALSFSSLCFLLVLGKILRVKIKLFQRLYLPSSVIGGLFGLIVLQACGDVIPEACTAGWSRLPGFLINIVFAALFLGMTIPPLTTIWNKCGPQLAYGQIVAWGQYAVGLGITLAILVPLFAVPGFFGTIVPVGFEGGHGTAAGLKETFETLNWTEGGDFALASATAGIISAIIVGMALINWAARHNITQKLKRIEDLPEKTLMGVYEINERPVAGYQTVAAESVDSLAFHLAIIGIAVLIGFFIKQVLINIESFFPMLAENKFLRAFPLFPLCMMGGVIIQIVLARFQRENIIDRSLMQRLSGTALDFLVVAAIATIRLPIILKGLAPFLIIVFAGIAWNVFCVLFLAKRLLPDAWFERAIAEMGQSMGVTATGLLLLRIVDSECETEAYSAFGYKQLLHEPFMGGGLWTSLAIPLAITQGPLLVFWISCAAVIVWLVVWFILFRKSILR